MRRWIEFLGGCCVTLFFLVTYQIIRGINFFKTRTKAHHKAQRERRAAIPGGRELRPGQVSRCDLEAGYSRSGCRFFQGVLIS